MRQFVLLIALLMTLCGSTALADDWPQWRGPDRTGISKETRLLKDWPEGGPKQLWSIRTAGKGYGSPSVVGGTIYVTGTEGNRGVLYAIGLDGKLKWKQEYGPEWTENHPQSRTQPTIVDGLAYVYGGQGTAACLDAKTGKIKWSVETLQKFKGSNITWGIAESPLVFDDKFICHPGGPGAAVVALNRQTGQTIWTTKGLSDKSGYCSPLLVSCGRTRQIVTQTAKNIVGIEADTGKVLWLSPQRNRHAVHPNTPLSFDGMIFTTCGYGYGSTLLKLSDDGSKASEIWRERKLDNHFQGVLYLGGLIYGSPSKGRLCCLEPKVGKVVFTAEEVRKAAIIFADDRLYAYDEMGGKVTLLEITPAEFKAHGSFEVTEGSGPHWSHLVVANGRLYVRRGEALLCFDVRAK